MSSRRFLRELISPSRTARAIPLGRLAIGSLFAFVALFLAFTLHSMGVQLPFVSHPYTIYAEFSDAAGLDPGNGPPVSVAGVPEGQVTGVRYLAGRARVTLQLGSGADGRVFRDASARVRPFNGANFLEVDILPGHPSAGALPAGATIDVGRTSIPVNTDQVLDVLDADTRAYLQVLTEQTGVALHGTGGPLARALARLAPLSGEARRIGDMLAERTRLISQLVDQTNTIFGVLGRRHAELASIVGAGTRLLSVTEARSRQITAATRALPSVLARGQSTSAAIAALAPTLERALARLAPAATAFGSGLRAAQTATPALNAFVDALRSLVGRTSTPGRELVQLAAGLGGGIAPAIAGYQAFAQVAQAVVAHQKPIAQFSDAISGVLSTQDAYGPIARVKLIGIETPTAADLGLAPAAARRVGRAPSKLDTMLARALKQLCQTEPVACVLAAATPGLPSSIVPARDLVRPVLHHYRHLAP